MKYFKVITKVFSDGVVKCHKQIYANLTEIPENYQGKLSNCDIFHDWFDIEEEANNFIKESERK